MGFLFEIESLDEGDDEPHSKYPRSIDHAVDLRAFTTFTGSFPQLYTIHTGCLTVRSGAGCRREPDRSQPDQAHWARQIGGCTRAGATSSGLLLFDQNELVTT